MKNIIIIDMQKGFINKNNIFLIDKINNYLQNNKFDNIFYTKFVNVINGPFVEILKWKGMEKEKDQEFVVNYVDNSIIFTKEGYGLTNVMLDIIKQKGIKEIEICGTDIDACVMKIGYDLFDSVIKPIFLKDLCASSSSDKKMKQKSLDIILRSFGKDCVK